MIGGQYELSVGKLISYPVPFSGDGPDLYLSAVRHGRARRTATTSFYDPNCRYYDGVTKWKAGFEGTVQLPALAGGFAAIRQGHARHPGRSYGFAVVSPRVILRTDWQATDQIVLQYSHWFNGGRTLIRVGDPPVENINWVPDKDMISLSASMWW